MEVTTPGPGASFDKALKAFGKVVRSTGTTFADMQKNIEVKGSKTFCLVRDVDKSGVSGIGMVAWGVQFPDGIVVTRWCSSETRQTCVWATIKDVEAVHGHDGATRIVWD